jgi:hypothetical protein
VLHAEVAPADAGSAEPTLKTKRTLQFMGSHPTGFKVWMDYQPPQAVPGATWRRCSARCAGSSRRDCRFDGKHGKRALLRL